jgi:hypothetical protein
MESAPVILVCGRKVAVDRAREKHISKKRKGLDEMGREQRIGPRTSVLVLSNFQFSISRRPATGLIEKGMGR